MSLLLRDKCREGTPRTTEPSFQIFSIFFFLFQLDNDCEELLPGQSVDDIGKITLVIDLDETLIHASATESTGFDFSITIHNMSEPVDMYIFVRPGSIDLIRTLGPFYEIVIFTASSQEYADAVIDRIDPFGMVKHRLYKESCLLLNDCRVKDLSLLNRKLDRVIIMDNSPTSYVLHPNNSIAIRTWTSDKSDQELFKVMEMLMEIKDEKNIYKALSDRRG